MINQNCKRSAIYFSLGLVIIYALGLAGCASIKEKARGIIGISTQEIEAARKDAIKNDFNYEYSVCYDKVLGLLKLMGAYIYTEDKQKNMLAIYVSESDTTTVGIFLKEKSKNSTQIEVSSASAYAKELIARKLFSGLEKP